MVSSVFCFLLTVLVELVEEVVESFETYEHHQGSGSGQDVHATATGKTDGRHDPESGGCGETADHVFLFAEDDGSGADETDTTDDLCSDARDIPARRHAVHLDIAEAIGRDNHKQCRAQCDEEMGAEASLLSTVFTLEPDKSSEQGGNENS